jgi:hypothetical protein
MLSMPKDKSINSILVIIGTPPASCALYHHILAQASGVTYDKLA